MNLKVLHILTSARAEGTPRLVLDWLSNEKIEQAVLFLNAQPNDLLPLFQQTSKQLFLPSLNVPKNSIKRNFFILNWVYKTCKITTPEVVISWNQGYSNWIIAGAKWAGVKKTIVHIGCASEHHKNFKSLLFSYYVHWPLWLMKAKLVCASRYLQNQYKSIPLLPSNNIYQVYNCIQYEKFIQEADYTLNNEKPVAIMVANLEPIKNHESLLRCWSKVTRIISNAELWIVGRGSLLNYLKNITRDLSIEEHVKFLGHRHDVPQLLWQSKVFVFTSLSEGFGTVLIEAIAAGLYVVAYSQPAAEELLSNHPQVSFVPANNEELMAEKLIEKLLSEPIEFDNAQLEFLKQFSVENMINGYMSLFCLKT